MSVIKTCEGCKKRPGELNSNFWKDENNDGHWICYQCEIEAEENYSCPCGCGDDPKICVYRNR